MNTLYSVKDCCTIDVPTYTDERGSLSVIEKEFPFNIKRVFWLHHINDGQCRGGHALLEGEEIMCCLHGSFVLELYDGVDTLRIEMDNPEMGVLIRAGVWFFTHSYINGGVTLVFASNEYSRDSYIYDYDEFVRLRG